VDPTPWTITAAAGGSGKPASPEAVAAAFANADGVGCPASYGVRTSAGAPLPADLAKILSINAGGFLEVDEANYDGREITARVKAFNGGPDETVKDFTIPATCTG